MRTIQRNKMFLYTYSSYLIVAPLSKKDKSPLDAPLHPSLSCRTCLQLIIRILLMSFSTSSLHPELVSYYVAFGVSWHDIFLAVFTASSIHRTVCHIYYTQTCVRVLN
jgi:hypothetical protein